MSQQAAILDDVLSRLRAEAPWVKAGRLREILGIDAGACREWVRAGVLPPPVRAGGREALFPVPAVVESLRKHGLPEAPPTDAERDPAGDAAKLWLGELIADGEAACSMPQKQADVETPAEARA